jgi:hypothetical protein
MFIAGLAQAIWGIAAERQPLEALAPAPVIPFPVLPIPFPRTIEMKLVVHRAMSPMLAKHVSQLPTKGRSGRISGTFSERSVRPAVFSSAVAIKKKSLRKQRRLSVKCMLF